MFKYFLVVFCLMLAYSFAGMAQLCHLNARYEERTSKVIFDWNMIRHSTKTAYVLLKSTDTKTWTEIVTDKVRRNYTPEDVFDYDERVSRDQKFFYRLKIIDENNETVTVSNTVTISTEAEQNTWVIYPNPVNNILHLSCQGSNIINGVINVTVQDITGKIVIRFRAASINRKLEIPVSQLLRGMYIVQISITNEIVMTQKFLKQP
ncbi:MAG: T9SS type A sorting domain-containing protein [Ginsengibacter sp.]